MSGGSSLAVILGLTFFGRLISLLLQSTDPLAARHLFGRGLDGVALASSLYAASTLAARFFLSARQPPRRLPLLMLGGFGLLVVALTGIWRSGSFSAFLFFIALAGLGTALVMPFLLSLVSLTAAPGRREAGLSFYALTLSVSLVVGPTLAALVLRWGSLRGVYGLLLLSAVFGFLLLFGGRGSLERRLEHRGAGAIPPGGPLAQKVGALLRNRLFQDTFTSLILFNLAFAAVLSFGGIYAEERFHVNLAGVQGLLLDFFGASLVVRIVLSAFTHRRGLPYRDLLFGLSLLLTGVSLFFLGLAPGILWYAVGFWLLGIPHALLFPLGSMRVAEAVPTGDLVAANTLFQAAFEIANAVGPLLLAPVAREIGIGGGFLLLGAVMPFSFWRVASEDWRAVDGEREIAAAGGSGQGKKRRSPKS